MKIALENSLRSLPSNKLY